MILILSDDYFFIEGLSETLTFTRQSCCNIFVSDFEQLRMYVKHNSADYYERHVVRNSIKKTIEQLSIDEDDICIIAFESDALMCKFSEIVSEYTKKAIIVHDTRIGDILRSLPRCGFINKHAETYDFIHELRNFHVRIHKGLRLNCRERKLLELYSSGTSVEDISNVLGNSVKSCYGKKYALMVSNGFSRSNAYSVLLLEKLNKISSFFS